MWYLTSVIPALRKRRQGDLKEVHGYPWLHVGFKVSLGYRAPYTKQGKKEMKERERGRERRRKEKGRTLMMVYFLGLPCPTPSSGYIRI